MLFWNFSGFANADSFWRKWEVYSRHFFGVGQSCPVSKLFQCYSHFHFLWPVSVMLLLLLHCCLAPCKSVTNYGPLTEPKFYIVKSGLTQIPTSNGHISETKRGILDPLVPKFFSRRGLSSPLSWKWANVTLSPSFGLFQSEKPLFRGVPEGSQGTSLARICPQVPFPRGKKKIYMAPHTLACRVKFMSSFV